MMVGSSRATDKTADAQRDERSDACNPLSKMEGAGARGEF